MALNNYFSQFPRINIAIITGIGLAVIFVFLPVFNNGFVLDDYWWLVNAMSWQQHPWMNIWSGGDVAFFEPVTNLFWYLGYKYFYLDSRLYYMSTILLHILMVGISMKMVQEIVGSWKPAFFFGIIYSLYPSHFEAVYYLSAVDTLFQTFFYVLSIWMYIRYHETSKTRYYLMTMGFMGIAFMAKQSTATLVAVLFLVDGLYKPLSKKTVARLIPFMVITVVYVSVLFVQMGIIFPKTGEPSVANPNIIAAKPKNMSYQISAGGINTWVRTIGGLIVSPFHRGMFFNPFKFPYEDKLLMLMLLLMVMLMGYLIFAGNTYRRQLLLGIGWMVCTLIPFVFWKNKLLTASRYTHLPSLGLSLFWAISLYDVATFFSKRGKRILATGIPLIILSFFFVNGVLESREMSKLPPYVESRRTREIIDELVHVYRLSGKPIYLYRFEGLKPWQMEPISRLYFEGNLHSLKSLDSLMDFENSLVITMKDGRIIASQTD